MSTVHERWLDYHGKDHDEPKAKTPPKSRPPMSRKPKVEAFALVAANGEVVDLKLHERWLAAPTARDTTVRLVPFDPDAARVLRLVERFLRGNLFDESSVAALRDLRVAVERRQKRGAK